MCDMALKLPWYCLLPASREASWSQLPSSVSLLSVRWHILLFFYPQGGKLGLRRPKTNKRQH